MKSNIFLTQLTFLTYRVTSSLFFFFPLPKCFIKIYSGRAWKSIPFSLSSMTLVGDQPSNHRLVWLVASCGGEVTNSLSTSRDPQPAFVSPLSSNALESYFTNIMYRPFPYFPNFAIMRKQTFSQHETNRV